MKKLLVGLVVVGLSFTACGTNTIAAIYDNDSRIASQGNSFSYYADVKQTIDDNQYKSSVHGMDGMDTVWTLDAEDDTEVEIDFNIQHQSGEMKLVLISPDGETENIIECTEETSVEGSPVYELKKGENRIKVVSKDKAEFDLNLSINQGSFEELGM